MSSSGPGPAPTESGQNSSGGGGIIERQVKKIVAGFLATGVLSLFGTIAAFGIGIIDTIRSSLTSAGAGIASEAGSIGDQFIELVIRTPIEAAGDFVASTGFFAPILSALIWALVAAMAAAIVYVTWRAIVVIT